MAGHTRRRHSAVSGGAADPLVEEASAAAALGTSRRLGDAGVGGT
jgi:hypothetical protein